MEEVGGEACNEDDEDEMMWTSVNASVRVSTVWLAPGASSECHRRVCLPQGQTSEPRGKTFSN